MNASMEEQLPLTHFQIEVLLRYLIKSNQIVSKLEQNYSEIYSELVKDTYEVPALNIEEVHNFIKTLADKIGLEFPFKD